VRTRIRLKVVNLVRCLYRRLPRPPATNYNLGRLALDQPFQLLGGLDVVGAERLWNANLQHDERLLPDMFSTPKKLTLHIVIGSRHVQGGNTGGFGCCGRCKAAEEFAVGSPYG
jgi:hypothetical protein